MLILGRTDSTMCDKVKTNREWYVHVGLNFPNTESTAH